MTPERGAIDAGVGADLDIVADLDAADLRKFLVTVAGADEAEAVGAEDAAGVQHGAISDGDVFVDCHVGMQQAIVADADIRTDGAVRADAGTLADAARLRRWWRTDRWRRMDAICGIGSDHGSWMNAGFDGRRRIKQTDDAGEARREDRRRG